MENGNGKWRWKLIGHAASFYSIHVIILFSPVRSMKMKTLIMCILAFITLALTSCGYIDRIIENEPKIYDDIPYMNDRWKDLVFVSDDETYLTPAEQNEINRLDIVMDVANRAGTLMGDSYSFIESRWVIGQPLSEKYLPYLFNSDGKKEILIDEYSHDQNKQDLSTTWRIKYIENNKPIQIRSDYTEVLDGQLLINYKNQMIESKASFYSMPMTSTSKNKISHEKSSQMLFGTQRFYSEQNRLDSIYTFERRNLDDNIKIDNYQWNEISDLKSRTWYSYGSCKNIEGMKMINAYGWKNKFSGMGLNSGFDFSKKDSLKNEIGTIYAFKDGKIAYIFSGTAGGGILDRLFLINSYSNKWQIKIYRRDIPNGPLKFESLQEIEFDRSNPNLILTFSHYYHLKVFNKWDYRSFNFVYEYDENDALSALHIYEGKLSSEEFPEDVNEITYILDQSFVLR